MSISDLNLQGHFVPLLICTFKKTELGHFCWSSSLQMLLNGLRWYENIVFQGYNYICNAMLVHEWLVWGMNCGFVEPGTAFSEGCVQGHACGLVIISNLSLHIIHDDLLVGSIACTLLDVETVSWEVLGVQMVFGPVLYSDGCFCTYCIQTRRLYIAGLLPWRTTLFHEGHKICQCIRDIEDCLVIYCWTLICHILPVCFACCYHYYC